MSMAERPSSSSGSIRAASVEAMAVAELWGGE
jgi:hypothetical protein